MPRFAEMKRLAVAHLQSNDPTLKALIAEVGPVRLRLERDRFQMLVRSIISQQLSTASARTIRGRVQALLDGQPWSAETVNRLDDAALRSAGLSRQKIAYVRDLCRQVESGTVPLAQLGRWSDERVIETLTQVHGIGRWTAQMFLIFSLGRPDVLPVDDLGVRAAVKNLYRLEALPNRQELEELAQPWRPYASIASWYCWRSVDIRPADPGPAAGYPV